MTGAAARHRLLDQAAAHALGNAPGNALIPHDFVERGTPGARQGLSVRDADNGRTEATPSARARSGDFHRAPRSESAAARKERGSAEVASAYGVDRDDELDDAIPF